jgi:hypothetical protein
MKPKYQKLVNGDTVRAGDVILRPNRGGASEPLFHPNRWIAHVIGKYTPHTFARPIAAPAKPTLDPEMVRAKRAVLRARRKTTLGKLEALLAERAGWQRKRTIAENKFAQVQREIDRLATTLARSKFDGELGGTPDTDTNPEPAAPASILNLS